jgi:hypothetical protein
MEVPTTSSIGFQNTKNPPIGEDTPNTEKQATGAISAFNEPSGNGVRTYSKDLASLLDGNRAYTPKYYCDAEAYKQDMIDQYESIKAEYSD